MQTSPSKRATAESLINSTELNNHIDDVNDGSNSVMPSSPKTNLLNTIKLPKKLFDIAKRLPKANYSSPIILKKKVLDIKIAKGFPEIFEKPQSQLSSERRKKRYQTTDRSGVTPKVNHSINYDPPAKDIQSLIRNKLFKRIARPDIVSPTPNYPVKIKLPKIQRISTNHHHNYSVNYSCRSLTGKRPLVR